MHLIKWLESVCPHLSSKIKVRVIGEVDGGGFIRPGLVFNSQCFPLKQTNQKLTISSDYLHYFLKVVNNYRETI